MKNHILIASILISAPLSFAHSDNLTVQQLLKEYKSQGAGPADAKQGEILWQKTYLNKAGVSERSCTSCHTKQLSNVGKHIRTNKEIKPMSPLANPQRLTNIKKINKWFKRNCKWTMGRECSAQEKANILVYIDKQSIK